MMIFEWDEPKRIVNLPRHGLDFADVEDIDWFGALVETSYSGRRGEVRYKAIATLYDDLVAIIFSRLGSEAVSIISLRPASRKERNGYAER